MLKRTVLIIVGIFISLFSICSVTVGEKVNSASSVKNPTVNNQTHEEYLIQPGDLLSIKFFYNSGLNEEQIIVLPDGSISLQLVQGVMAAGMTVNEFTNLLSEKYTSKLEEPDITVIVHRTAQKIYVGGEVEDPQMINLEGPITVLQAILQAGGFNDIANHNKVIVIRNNSDNSRQIIPVNIKEVIKGTDLTQDIQLMPNDIVYVKEAYF